ncbi:hypothetical protein [Luteibacter sp. 9135]|uniref:hypothetical protein n=1 Tax=Luteibacter sp. 9135 TaxID=1500893 RepID=UPI000563BA15|nr:hypothetical protein [Luteibacter sp. 9135]
MSPDEITPSEDDDIAANIIDPNTHDKEDPSGDVKKTPPSDSTDPTPRDELLKHANLSRPGRGLFKSDDVPHDG